MALPMYTPHGYHIALLAARIKNLKHMVEQVCAQLGEAQQEEMQSRWLPSLHVYDCLVVLCKAQV